MTVRQHQRLRRDFAAQFTKRYDRSSESDCANKDTEEDFGQMDIHQHRRQTGVMVQIAVKANQYRRQAHETVQNRDQLRHLGHLNFFRHADANRAANNHGDQNPCHVAGIRPKNGRQQRDRHPGNTEVIPLAGRFML